MILELKLWGNKSGKELPLSDEVRHQYISAISMADTPMRLDAPKERRGSIPSIFSSTRDSGDPSQRRRGGVLSSADIMGVRRKNSTTGSIGSCSSQGSAPTSSKGTVQGFARRREPVPLSRASTGPLPGTGKAGTSSTAAAAAAAAAAAVPEKSDSFKSETGDKAGGEAGSKVGGEAGGEAGGKAGGEAGASTQAPPRLERRPSKEAMSFGATESQSFKGFSEEDLNTVVDLRVFMDPAPHTISELAPMASVYHMFNQVS